MRAVSGHHPAHLAGRDVHGAGGLGLAELAFRDLLDYMGAIDLFLAHGQYVLIHESIPFLLTDIRLTE